MGHGGPVSRPLGPKSPPAQPDSPLTTTALPSLDLCHFWPPLCLPLMPGNLCCSCAATADCLFAGVLCRLDVCAGVDGGPFKAAPVIGICRQVVQTPPPEPNALQPQPQGTLLTSTVKHRSPGFFICGLKSRVIAPYNARKQGRHGEEWPLQGCGQAGGFTPLICLPFTRPARNYSRGMSGGLNDGHFHKEITQLLRCFFPLSLFVSGWYLIWCGLILACRPCPGPLEPG